jgi:hypothetical protein
MLSETEAWMWRSQFEKSKNGREDSFEVLRRTHFDGPRQVKKRPDYT